jgi:high affinity Mn2+ porin
LVWNLRKANTSNLEFELHRGLLPKKDGIIRLLAYVNNANMGIYRYANEQYLQVTVAQPDIDNDPFQVTTKYGFGINMEQALSKDVTAYGRFGWDNGKTESWSFTEIDQRSPAASAWSGTRGNEITTARVSRLPQTELRKTTSSI